MDTVLKSGQMGLGMRDNGRITEHMAMENLFMWMETSMKVTGSMTRRMDSEFTSMSTEQGTKVIGETTFNMARERRHGLMAQFMKENT
jgi:hypothetical protein